MINKSKNNELKQKLKHTYATQVYPQIKNLEQLRIKCLTLTFFVYILAILFFIFLPVIINNIYTVPNYENKLILILPLSMFGLPALAVFIFLISKISSIYTKSLKKYYNILAESVGLKWAQGDMAGIPENIKNSKLFLPANKIKYDDIFAGKYKDVSIRITESEIIDDGYRTKNSSESHPPISLFKGVIINFKSNKNIPCTTLIKPKIDFIWHKKLFNYFVVLFWTVFGFAVIIGGIMQLDFMEVIAGLAFFFGFGSWFVYSCFIREIHDKKGLQKIKLEDVKLAKYYNAYSYSQIEGRYLLTTAFIERFMNVSEAFNNYRIRCSYVDNNLVLAIPTRKNMFEIGNLYTSLNNPNHIDKLIDEIISILLLVDYFKLDTNTNL